MKKSIFLSMLLAVIVSVSATAQSSFETAMRGLHLKAVNTCGMVKSQNGHNKDKIVASFNELKSMALETQKKYTNNRPKGYEKDPLFASYFVQFIDIANHQIALVSKENYKVATMNCSQFCMTFKKMHAINGTTDLTDVMFNLNMQMSMTMFMVDAGNIRGAQMSFAKVPAAYKMVQNFKNKKADAEFNRSFKKINALFNDWLNAMNAKNYDKAKELFKTFSASFPPVFKQSI